MKAQKYWISVARKVREIVSMAKIPNGGVRRNSCIVRELLMTSGPLLYWAMNRREVKKEKIVISNRSFSKGFWETKMYPSSAIRSLK